MNFKSIVGGVIVTGALLAGAAGAQTVTLPNGSTIAAPVGQNVGNRALRHERGSARNIYRVRIRLERLIDQLQNDQHDFGGHRIQAVQLMQQARQQLLLAEQWDLQHPGSSPTR